MVKKSSFNGPEKSEEDITKAIKNDSLIHIDHLDELYTISDWRKHKARRGGP